MSFEEYRNNILSMHVDLEGGNVTPVEETRAILEELKTKLPPYQISIVEEWEQIPNLEVWRIPNDGNTVGVNYWLLFNNFGEDAPIHTFTGFREEEDAQEAQQRHEDSMQQVVEAEEEWDNTLENSEPVFDEKAALLRHPATFIEQGIDFTQALSSGDKIKDGDKTEAENKTGDGYEEECETPGFFGW